MNEPIKTTASRVSAADLEPIAREAVKRALAARKVMAELSPEQAHDVSGGAVFAAQYAFSLSRYARPPLINGKWPEPYQQLDLGQFKQF